MEGTQSPRNNAEVVSPLKYNTSEKTSERMAETNNNLSVIVNFFNINYNIFEIKKVKII